MLLSVKRLHKKEEAIRLFQASPVWRPRVAPAVRSTPSFKSSWTLRLADFWLRSRARHVLDICSQETTLRFADRERHSGFATHHVGVRGQVRRALGRFGAARLLSRRLIECGDSGEGLCSARRAWRRTGDALPLIYISEPTRLSRRTDAVFCFEKITNKQFF